MDINGNHYINLNKINISGIYHKTKVDIISKTKEDYYCIDLIYYNSELGYDKTIELKYKTRKDTKNSYNKLIKQIEKLKEQQ